MNITQARLVWSILGLALALSLAVGCEPSPQDYAAATATLMAAQALATRDALDAAIAATNAAGQAHATATALVVQAQATTTAVAASAMQTAEAASISIQATRTAVPYDASRVAAHTRAAIAQEWIGAFALLAGVGVAGLLGLALVAWLQTRARIVSPAATGQMPMIREGRTLIDPNRMIGAAAVAPPQPDWLAELARVAHFIRTGQALPPPETPPVKLADGEADADHLLESARIAGAVSIAASMFRPDNAERGRQVKLRLLTKGGPNPLGLLGGSSSGGVPATRVVAGGENELPLHALEVLAQQLGDHLPPYSQLPAPVFEASVDVEEEEIEGDDEPLT